jgi:crossover junction endodeoxyribonuclease RuvC
MMVVLGFDPGVTGAIAAHCNGKIVSVVDMPVVEKRISSGAVRHRVSAHGVTDIVHKLVDTYDTVEAWIEQVAPRPGEGRVSSFSFGRSVGVLEGVLAGLGVATSFVTPQEWMKTMRVPRDGSIGRAIELCPHLSGELSRKKDHGRADAILIALFGARNDL